MPTTHICLPYQQGDQAWAHGYEPLASLDKDSDGKLLGTELSQVWVWVDANSNAVVDKDEFSPSTQYVKSISVTPKVDAAGNAEVPVGAERLDGTTIPSWDWWSQPWKYSYHNDRLGIIDGVPRIIGRKIGIGLSSDFFPAHVYRFSIPGPSNTVVQGLLRFIQHGEDWYVMSIPDAAKPVEGEGVEPNSYEIFMTKVSKVADGKYTWKFTLDPGSDVSKVTLLDMGPKTGSVFQAQGAYDAGPSHFDYEWTAELLTSSEGLGTLSNSLSVLTRFSDKDFQDALRQRGIATQLSLYPGYDVAPLVPLGKVPLSDSPPSIFK